MPMPFRPALCGEKVMHVGDAVAAVVADTAGNAQDAADLVEVAYEELTPVITLDDAPKGYAEFDAGAATKYVLNPNGYIKAA